MEAQSELVPDDHQGSTDRSLLAYLLALAATSTGTIATTAS